MDETFLSIIKINLFLKSITNYLYILIYNKNYITLIRFNM